MQILTDAAEVHSLDLTTCTAADTAFTREFRVLASATASGKPAPAVHAIVLWFDTHFSERFCAQHPVTLSTSPHAPPTHWAQTVLMLRCGGHRNRQEVRHLACGCDDDIFHL